MTVQIDKTQATHEDKSEGWPVCPQKEKTSLVFHILRVAVPRENDQEESGSVKRSQSPGDDDVDGSAACNDSACPSDATGVEDREKTTSVLDGQRIVELRLIAERLKAGYYSCSTPLSLPVVRRRPGLGLPVFWISDADVGY